MLAHMCIFPFIRLQGIMILLLAVLAACVGAERESSIANGKPRSIDMVASLVDPLMLEDFLASVWDNSPRHFHHGNESKDDSDLDDAQQSREPRRPPLAAPILSSGISLDAMLHHYAPLFREQDKAAHVDVRLNGTRIPTNIPSNTTSSSSFLSSRNLMTLLEDEGKSTIFRLEYLDLPDADPVARLATAFLDVFGFPVSVHAYASGPSQSALQPHSDPYDVFVVQLSGSKDWTVRVVGWVGRGMLCDGVGWRGMGVGWGGGGILRDAVGWGGSGGCHSFRSGNGRLQHTQPCTP